MAEKKKLYASLDAKIAELDARFNKDVPDSVMAFWKAIAKYGNVCMDWGAEGNSGEFHDKDESSRIEDELDTVTRVLVDQFERHTGYTPEFRLMDVEVHIRINKTNDKFYIDRLPGIWVLTKAGR